MARYVKSGTVNTVQEINSELEKIATAQDEFLTRNGETPNEMKANLDMNSNRITNLKAPVSGTDAARLVDVTGEYDITVGIDESPVFDNIAEMTSTNLVVGQLVRCKRYYALGDLVDGLVYEIQATQTVEGFVDHALANTNVAILKRNKGYKVRQCGAIDGIDNTNVFVAISNRITAGDVIDFQSIDSLISTVSGTVDDFATNIFNLVNKNNITFLGNKASIRCVDFNIASNGGLVFILGSKSNGLTVRGFNFDMSFTGINTSSLLYPQCGAIVGRDAPVAEQGAQNQDNLNRDWLIEDNTFKLFHPSGQFAQSGAPYNGDPNNGFKIYPVAVFGPFDATDYENQPRNIRINKNTLKEGGNSYGFWTWAWNDVSVINNTAESFVGKQSNQSGVYSGIGEPMIRYHQFYCSGVVVKGNYFRAKPSDERLVAGFEGQASFFHYNTNLATGVGYGSCVVSDNVIISGNGDLAKSAQDWMIYLIACGAISITGNTFDSSVGTTNAFVSIGIFWNGQSAGVTGGKATLNIIGNSFSEQCDYMNNISISNGGSTDDARRLKQLNISNNNSMAQGQYFLTTSATGTFFGVQDTIVSDNIISGEFNTLWDSSSTNSRAIEIAGSETTDFAEVSRNVVRDKYYAIETNEHAGLFYADKNRFIGVTSKFLGSVPIISDIDIGAPTLAAKDGSEYIQRDGITSNVLFIRESGVWVAK